MQVLVTGANGHLGSQLVPALLGRGHAVRATVRDPSDAAKAGPLRAAGAEVVAMDLDRPGELRAAMEGIEVAFHAAAVYSYHGDADEILRAAIDGSQAALRAAADARVRKLVLTSSCVTLPMKAPGEPDSTEDDWTTDLRVPYLRAKTLAEQRAWALAKELGLNLVTLLPGGILGPGFTRPTPSVDVITAIAGNAFRMGCPVTNFPYVDVRDVVDGHVLAAEQDAQGRFILINDRLPMLRDLVESLHRADPRIARPWMDLPGFMVPMLPLLDWLNAKTLGVPRTASAELLGTLRGKRWSASNRRARDVLGWRQRIDLDRSLRDTLAAIRALPRGARSR